MMMMVRARWSVVAAVVAVTAVAAADTSYDLGRNGDNKVNILWESKTPVESIVGRSTTCDGILVLDAEKPERCYLRISVPVDSIRTGIPLRDEHLCSPRWLDAKKHPKIEFESSSVKPVPKEENVYEVKGKLTLHGVTKEYTIRGKATAMKPLAKEYEKFGYVGEIVHLEAAWDVKLGDHGVTMPEGFAGVRVSEQVHVSIDIFGFTNNNPHRDDPRTKNK